ncbi:choice-of-anchor I family protein [Fluviicola chungangensis]|uniref:T9SS type A sorting domain-containing protein n=1 Tax=Fluviicola chungangensis TaxID=2597671 RepID=A0A556MJ95_9FLAO|nr:choice-of-anchor I family protein [Fluviicola chungangensis]TSJ39942.1 T9SS type A sorting domain-containing protein [Fluviicola chungangensis]
MKKTVLFIGTVLMSISSFAQNPGLVISEILPNPSGTDSPFEWIELVATSNINFATTPYTVVCNNSAATLNGWIEGGTITYAFQLNSGIVNRGDVVYVGGSSMAPTGTKIRVINTATTAGDGFGTAASGGVVGNGGSNGDGIAVFNLPVTSLTNSTVPVDALFYGTALGTAVLNGGADGYQLPVNDSYSGGKLQASSFLAGDPGGDQTIRATGSYNTQTDVWTTARTWSVVTPTLDNLSNLSLLPAPGTFTFSAVTQNFAENAGTVNIGVNSASSNIYPAKVILSYSVYTDATEGVDFTLAEDTIVIPGGFNGIQNVGLTLVDDAFAERTEKVILKMSSLENATIGTNSFQVVYIKDNDYQAPTPNNELKLNLLSSFSNGAEGTNSAEIVAFDPTTDKLYIANSVGAKMDIVDLSNPSTPALLNSISISPYGNINSLTVHDGVVACAVENTNPQANGNIVFFDENGTFISQVPVGAMPDMVTFNNDYTKVLVACEGEPKSDYSVDPEGSVGIIDITGGYPSLTAANVTMVNFQSFNGQEAALRSQGIRIFGPGSSAAQDFEPEYITLSEDNSTAYVSLQENNAMAVINITAGTVTEIRPLGTMNYANGNNGLDASDQTAGIFIGSAPIKGLFMPDALAHASIAGTEYIFSANEGDAREYSTFSEIARLSATPLDVSIPDQNILKHNQFLGRINVTNVSGDTDNDGDIDEIHVFGTRSFSIWDAQSGALVFDSKDLIEQIISNHPTLSGLFNASNSSGAAVSKNRSDDKGPEPEGVATAFINGNHYLFVSLERVGGVMLFNVDVPNAPVYVGYYNNRSVATNGPDRGAEGIIVIKKEDSPTGNDIVILANEVSSTLSIFDINTCVDLAGAAITVPTDSICSGDQVTLTIPGNAQSSIQWLKDDLVIPGETGNSLNVTEAGDYRVFVSNTSLACADTTLSETIRVLTLPTITAGQDLAICIGDTVNLHAVSSETIAWNNSVQDGIDFFPTTTMSYIATATDTYGCANSDTLTVIVNLLPTIDAGTDQSVCTGTSVTFNATGAPSLLWNNGVTNGTPFNATIAGPYIVTGTDANGCVDSDTLVLALFALPNINLGADMTVCSNHFPVNLNGPGGYQAYNWSNGASTQNTIGAQAGSYILTVTNNNGCQDKDTIMIFSDPCLGLDENQVPEYTIYPNPASNTVFVETTATNSEAVIYASNGQVLFTQQNTGATFTLDVSGLAEGMYWLKVSSSEGSVTKQLLIKK